MGNIKELEDLRRIMQNREIQRIYIEALKENKRKNMIIIKPKMQ